MSLIDVSNSLPLSLLLCKKSIKIYFKTTTTTKTRHSDCEEKGYEGHWKGLSGWEAAAQHRRGRRSVRVATVRDLCGSVGEPQWGPPVAAPLSWEGVLRPLRRTGQALTHPVTLQIPQSQCQARGPQGALTEMPLGHLSCPGMSG
uniref:Uncharacterized protein n=1 Tax=Myotis myotis TaxID=51298 RepID=A0A7J7Y031_MYOMY|nr:hypothetical protein mMyoMyo1_011503 [Myotis myotis]